MLTEDYCNFDIAKLLKEKGFDWECRTRKFYPEPEYDAESSIGVYAPTLQMAMKWLRETHKLCISIAPQVTDDDGSGGCLWEWTVTHLLVPQSVSLKLFESYEEACGSAIKYCLENLI